MSKTKNRFTCVRARNEETALSQIACLIHQGNPYAYPCWRPDVNDFIDLIVPHMQEEGFIFNYRNIYIARETGSEQPLGILVAIDSHSNLDFDYAIFDDERSQFVIDNYLQKVIKTRKALPKNTALITDMCVAPDMRGLGIGSNLLYEYIWRSKVRGLNAFQLDCLQENQLATYMYQKMGFVITEDTAYGFDGTRDPQTKIYTMLYTF